MTRRTPGGSGADEPAPVEPTSAQDRVTADGSGTADEPLASTSYEAARDALAEIVAALEAGGLPLEQSLALWERGEVLAAECERWLAGARERLERGADVGDR